MEVITIENEKFSRLLINLEKLTRELQSQNKGRTTTKDQAKPPVNLNYKEQWLDNEEACEFLKVSKRTLQNYRDNFILPYSQIGRKVYYKTSDLQTLLEKNYITLNPP